MSSKVDVFINDEKKPANIPSYQTIITQCFHLGPHQATATNISGVRITLDKRSDNEVNNIWVKFGRNITMGEAKTQRFVAQYLEANDNTAVRAPRVYIAFTWGDFGFIVAEYIDGPICGDSDVALVAAAVQSLIAIPSPSSTPGPVGGGLIEHPFFINRTSSIWYESVQELEDHINGILYVTGKNRRSGRVSFGPKLCLCPSDLNCANFKKVEGNRIVALDFGGYSFLPPSFFAFVLYQGDPSNFTHRIARRVVYPPSKTEVAAMVSASCALVPRSSNDIGLSEELESRLR
ncbi:hypothetical protein EDB89DRAFT_818080 [Lactarius sanguifluus]|nr:hypothetical protein EDB89DRAFT_818080 [Lactarius sanguifluus]